MTLDKFKKDVETIAEGLKAETPCLSKLVGDLTGKASIEEPVTEVLEASDEQADPQIAVEEGV